jgi:Secretion system C-terminal sorting domain
MKNILFVLTCFLSSFTYSQSLSAGDIMFVGYNSDGTDALSFAVLKEIPANTTIYFTENDWQGSTFGLGESFFNWTNGSKTTAGTVIHITNLEKGTLGNSPTPATVNLGSMKWTIIPGQVSTANLANGNEVVYAYLGSAYNAPTTFLTAIANSGYSNVSGVGILPTSLSSGVNALEFTGDKDVLWYKGSTNCNSSSICISEILNKNNWDSADGSFDQTINFTPPLFFSNITLAVNLIYFEARSTLSNSVVLSWRTASEKDNAYFEVEHSTDGIHFSKIGSVKGQGTKKTFTDYEFGHTPSVSNNYYRLKQVDFDDNFSFSFIKNAFNEKQDKSIHVIQNMAAGEIMIDSDDTNSINFQIYNSNGQLIKQDKILAHTSFDIHALTSGFYILKTDKGSAKFIKN